MAANQSPSLPSICNLPYTRNPDFVGREDVLTDIHKGFISGKPSQRVQVVFGPAGAGKTHVAIEYAYRHAAEYGVIWWVAAEESATLATSFSALAAGLGQHLPQDVTLQSACRAVRHALGKRSDYLLIFDAAPGPAELEDLLPVQRTGHVLITSRNPSWRGLAGPQPLRGLKREESIQFLRKRTGNTDPDPVARKLASALDDLPMALEQAASLMVQSGLSFADYLKGYEEQWGRMLSVRRPSQEYSDSARMAWEMSYHKMQEAMPQAADVLNLCAFLWPEQIERQLLRGLALNAPEPLAGVLRNVLQLEEIIDVLRRFALIETSEKFLTIQRAGAAMTRDRMESKDRHEWIATALAGVALLFEFDSHDLQTWAKCGQVLPHALTVAGHAQEAGVNASTTAALLNDVGRYLHKRAQLTEAKAALEKSLILSREVYGQDHSTVAAVSNNLGRVLSDLGERDEAMRCYQQSLDIDQAAYGSEDPKVATVINNYAKSLFASGDVETSRKQFEWALSVYEQHYGADHPKVAAVINNLGYVLRCTGDPKTACQHFERALSLVESRYGQQHPHVATIYHNLGITMRDLADLPKAREHLEQALAIDEAVYGPTHPAVARDLDQLALVVQAQGQPDDSRQLQERALRIAEALHGESHLSLAPRLRKLSQLCAETGDTEQAARYLSRAADLQMPQLGTVSP